MDLLKELYLKRKKQNKRLTQFLSNQKRNYCIKQEILIPVKYKDHGWLYLFQSEDGYLKAGKSCHHSLQIRKQQHEHDYGCNFELITKRFIMNVSIVESFMHRMFKKYKVNVIKSDGSGTRECYNISIKNALIKFVDEISYKQETKLIE